MQHGTTSMQVDLDSGDSSEAVQSAQSGTQPNDEDPEIQLLTRVRLALSATLHLLECARDDMVALGERMDRLRLASERCREALENKKKKGESEQLENDSKAQTSELGVFR